MAIGPNYYVSPSGDSFVAVITLVMISFPRQHLPCLSLGPLCMCVCCVFVDSQASWREWVLSRWENLSHFLNSSAVHLSCAEVNRKTEQQTEQLRNNSIPRFRGAGVHAVKHFIKGGRLCLVRRGRCCGLSPVPGGPLAVISKTLHNAEDPGDALPKCFCC